MHHQPNRTRTTRLALAALAVVLLGACSSGGGSNSTLAPTTAAARPASTAKLTILTPRNGQTLSRRASEVRLNLLGAKIVSTPPPGSGLIRATSTCWSTASWWP
jgi:hypothetical protein